MKSRRLTVGHGASTKLVISVIFVFGMVLIATPTYAQTIGESNQSSQSYGASNQTDFQNASFQQTSSGTVPMAGGSADILKQLPGQQITVTGAPAYVAPPAEPDNMTSVVLWGLFIVSGLGIAALYYYQKKSQKNHSPEEASELSAVFDPPKPKSQKPKKAKAKPSKKKKTHR